MLVYGDCNLHNKLDFYRVSYFANIVMITLIAKDYLNNHLVNCKFNQKCLVIYILVDMAIPANDDYFCLIALNISVFCCWDLFYEQVHNNDQIGYIT